jgi:bacteriocin leader peptide (microcyclamide/patellamide family)
VPDVARLGFFSTKKGTDPPQRVNKPNNKKRIILMDKKNILPHQGKPVIRITNGTLPSHLAELSEEALGEGVGASWACSVDASWACSVDASWACSVDASWACSYDDGEA